MTATPRLASICIITADIRRLFGFYETVTGVDAAWATDEFAELQWPGVHPRHRQHRDAGPVRADVAQPAANPSVVVEFLVDDVDTD